MKNRKDRNRMIIKALRVSRHYKWTKKWKLIALLFLKLNATGVSVATVGE